MDVTLLILGDSLHTCGEWDDRSDLDLPGGQLDLLQAVVNGKKNTKSKIIVVVVGGRPSTFGAATSNQLLEQVDAVLWAGRPGEEGKQNINIKVKESVCIRVHMEALVV